jgi:hypothetical protein
MCRNPTLKLLADTAIFTPFHSRKFRFTHWYGEGGGFNNTHHLSVYFAKAL